MTRALITTVAIMALTALLGACASVQPSTANAQVADVTRFLDSWNAALAARDKVAVRAAYSESPDFRWFEDGILRYRSAEAVVAALDQFPPGTKLDTTLADVSVLPLEGNRVHVSAGFKTRIAMPQGAFEFSGVFTAVLERKDAGYAFLVGHTSSMRQGERRN